MNTPFALPQIDRVGKTDESVTVLPRPFLTTSLYLYNRRVSDDHATHQYAGNPYLFGRTVNEVQPIGEEYFSVAHLPVPDAALAFQVRLMRGGEVWLSFLSGEKPLYPAVLDRPYDESIAPGFLLPPDSSSIYVDDSDKSVWFCRDANIITLTGIAFLSAVNVVWFSRMPG